MPTDNLTKLIARAMTMLRGLERSCLRTMLGGTERPHTQTMLRGLLLSQQPGRDDLREISLEIALADNVAKLREITLATTMLQGLSLSQQQDRKRSCLKQ